MKLAQLQEASYGGRTLVYETWYIYDPKRKRVVEDSDRNDRWKPDYLRIHSFNPPFNETHHRVSREGFDTKQEAVDELHRLKKGKYNELRSYSGDRRSSDYREIKMDLNMLSRCIIVKLDIGLSQ